MVKDDFKVIARLLAAIRASEESPVFDTALVDEKVLKTTEKTGTYWHASCTRLDMLRGCL